MPFDPNASDLTVAVVGTGTMGRGIMQVSAQGGMRVIAYDEKPGAAQAAKDYIAKTLDGLVEKGRVPEADAKAAVDRIVVAKDMGESARPTSSSRRSSSSSTPSRRCSPSSKSWSGPTRSSPPTRRRFRSRRSPRSASTPSASAACTSSIRCR